MTPLHGQKYVPRPLPMPGVAPQPAAATSAVKVQKVAAKVVIPEAPGPMPDSPTVNKVKTDIQKTKDVIAPGGKVPTFTEQVAEKAVEITSKSRDLLPAMPEAQQEEKPPEPTDTKHDHHKGDSPSIKQHVWSKVSLAPEHQTTIARSEAADPKAQPYSKQKDVEEVEDNVQKAIFEKASSYRRKVIQDDIDRSKGRIQ